MGEQYRTERFNGKAPSYDGFLRQIHEVIYMPDRNHYIWQKGEPTQAVINKLKEQNAVIEIETQTKSTTQIELVPIDDDNLPF